jgi:hypothetical protein
MPPDHAGKRFSNQLRVFSRPQSDELWGEVKVIHSSVHQDRTSILLDWKGIANHLGIGSGRRNVGKSSWDFL